MNEPIRFSLKPEDRAPADPQAVGIELMGLLRTLADDGRQLRSLLATWGDDPITVHRRAAARSAEMAEAAARALDAGETLMRALRAARLFSDAYEGREARHER
jgi:hypothetical protein